MDFQRDEKEINRRRMMQVGKYGLAVLLLIVAVFAVKLLIHPSLKTSRIRIATVDRGTIRATIQATGTLQPGDELVLVAPFESRVLQLHAKPGQQLDADTPILQLDDRDVRTSITRLSDEIELKKNMRDRLEIERERSIDRMKSNEETTTLRVAYLEAKRLQQEKLHDMGAATPWAVRQAKLDEDIARVELKHQLREAEQQNESFGKEIEGVEIELRLLQNERDELEKNLQDAKVLPGAKGALVWVQEEIGVTVRKGEVVARVANLDWYRVETKVSDMHAGRIRVGMPVVVTTFEDTLDGFVSSIPPAVEKGEMTVNVKLNDPHHANLRPNLRADVFIVTGEVEGTLRLPKGPAISGGGKQNLFVISGREAVRTPVTLGLAGVDGYEIVTGLSEGDRVILSDMRDYQHLEKIKLR